MSFCYSANYLLSLTQEIIVEYIKIFPELKNKLIYYFMKINKIKNKTINTFKNSMKIYNSRYSNNFTELSDKSILNSWKYNRNEYYNKRLRQIIKNSTKKRIKIGGGFLSKSISTNVLQILSKIVFKMVFNFNYITGTKLQKKMLDLIEAENNLKGDTIFINSFNYILFTGLARSKDYKINKKNNKNNYINFIKSKELKSAITLKDFDLVSMYLTVLLTNFLVYRDDFINNVIDLYHIFLKDEETMIFEIKDILEKDAATLCNSSLFGHKAYISKEKIIDSFLKIMIKKQKYFLRDNDIDDLNSGLQKLFSIIDNSYLHFTNENDNAKNKELPEISISPVKLPPKKVIQHLIIHYFKRYDKYHDINHQLYQVTNNSLQIFDKIFDINYIPEEIKKYFIEYPLFQKFCLKVIQNVKSRTIVYSRIDVIKDIESASEKILKYKINVKDILNRFYR